MIRNPSAAVSRLRRSVRTAGAAALVAFVAVGALLAGAAPATAATDGDKYVIGTDTTFAPFEFSEPYFTSGVQLGVLEASDIQSLDDLDGKTVAVKTGTQG